MQCSLSYIFMKTVEEDSCSSTVQDHIPCLPEKSYVNSVSFPGHPIVVLLRIPVQKKRGPHSVSGD